ncbi:MAG: hypothetical protein R3F39_25135 [Myxococcota bacterium]
MASQRQLGEVRVPFALDRFAFARLPSPDSNYIPRDHPMTRYVLPLCARIRPSATLLVALALSIGFVACDSGGSESVSLPGGSKDVSGFQPGGSDAADVGPGDVFTGPGDTGPDAAPNAEPRLGAYEIGTFTGDVFPTYLAHLFGRELGDTQIDLVGSLEVENPSAASQKVLVRVALDGYSNPREALLTLAPWETRVIALTPTLNLAQLYSVKAPIGGAVTIELRNPADEGLYDKVVEDVTVAPVNTAFWAVRDDDGQWVDISGYVAVMVTPHDEDNAISSLLTRAASHSQFDSMIGYQYDGRKELLTVAPTVAPGDCASASEYYRKGTPVTVDVDVTCALCVSYNATYGLYNNATESYVTQTGNLGEWTSTITIPADGSYRHVMCNPSSNSSSRSFTLRYSMGLQGGAVDQIGAIFDALKADGMKYTSVAGDFFDASQYVKLPAESLSTGSQNCIDGALVFASALESMGMKPLIAIIPGHAFVGVRIFDDPTAPILALETTMVSTDSAINAINEGLRKFGVASDAGTLRLVDIAVMRAHGVSPIPK